MLNFLIKCLIICTKKFNCIDDVVLLGNVEWNTSNSAVGGNINESLTIDCGAKGDPEPIIEIADANGQSVEGIS